MNDTVTTRGVRATTDFNSHTTLFITAETISPVISLDLRTRRFFEMTKFLEFRVRGETSVDED